MATIPKSKLTKEYLEQYAQKQSQLYLDTEHVNEELARQYIIQAYKVAGLKEPTNFVWFDSPIEFAKDNSVWASVGDSVWASVGASVRDSVRDSVWASVRASVRDSVWASVRASSVGDSVRDSVWASVRDSVGDSVRASVGAWIWSEDMSFYKYFNDNLEENNLRHLAQFTELVNGFLLTKDTVYIVRKPIRLVLGADGRPHYDHDMAIEWANGDGFYYLHGVEFDKETWKKIVDEKLTLEDLAKGDLTQEQNAAAIRMLRADRMLKQLNAKLINIGERGIELYEVPKFMGTQDTEYCMKMEHPSIKGKFYIEWVHPDIGKQKDADLAIATNRNLTKEEYLTADIA